MMIQEQLMAWRDLSYRDFICSLMPTVDPTAVLGVRTPLLRQFSKQLYQQSESIDFLSDLPHRYFEENQLHIFMIEQEKDLTRCLSLTQEFLPYIDNWATCDQFAPKVFATDLNGLLSHTQNWIDSPHVYTVRFGINMLMRHFLDDAFNAQYLDWIASLRSEDYYIKMMVAWFFATALAKQYSATIPYLEQRKLPDWTHKKTIQKAVESRRITAAQKYYLRTLK